MRLKNESSHDPYLYEDCDVLRNKLNIKDSKKLEEAERTIMNSAMSKIDFSIQSKTFDYNRLKEINKTIFEDIYDWAGEERVIPIVKGEPVLGGDTVRYSEPDNVKKDAEKAIKTLNNTDWNNLNHNDKVEIFSKSIAALWQAHPFREGNTRTVMTFACQFSDEHSFSLNREIFQDNAKYLRDSLVKASDGQYSEYEYLERIIGDAIESNFDKCDITPKNNLSKTSSTNYAAKFSDNESTPINMPSDNQTKNNDYQPE
jgi:cell filamentation protein